MGIINLILFVFVYFYLKARGLHKKIFRGSLKDMLLFLFGVIIAILIESILIIILYKSQKVSIIHSKVLISNAVVNILIVLFNFLCVAFFEETLFRCALFESICMKRNKFMSLILCSLIFSVLHFIHYSTQKNWYLIILMLFLIGILLGLVYIITNSLMWSIGFHFAWNSFQVLMLTEKDIGTYSPISFKISAINIENYYIVSILLLALIGSLLLAQRKNLF